MRITKKLVSIVLALLMILPCISIIGFAEETEGSEHLTEVPEGYVGIYTKDDLDNVRNNLKGNYILMNDIVFDDSDFEESGNFYNDGMGWVPIGGVFDKWSAYYYEFTGVFDGNGYSIINIKMDRKPTSYSAYPRETVTLPDGSTLTTYSTHAFGLFVENLGIIEDLNVYVEYKIDANPYAVAGGICGINSGLISNCNTYGTIFAEKTLDSGDSCFGGIAGLIDNGKITFCANNVDISGKNPYDFPYINCGGIVGGSNGKGKNAISCCYNNGDITPETVSDGYLAGIAARASGFGTYYNGYSFVIENCYNTGAIGNENTIGQVAGICGEGYHEETKLINCYNVGLVLSSSKTAGIIAGADRSTNCYYLDGSADYYCTALSTIKNNLHNSQMKTEEAFVGFDFNNVWIVDANSDYPYPQLKNNLQSDATPIRHNYSETILVDSTCTKLGLKKLFCTDCGFSCEVVMNKSETHTYTSSITTPATHLTEGVETFTCDCGDTYTETIDEIAEHDHKSVVTAPTCTEQGYTTYTCECGDTYVDDYVAENGHDHKSEITTPATHLTTGVMTFICTCGDTYTEVIDKIATHNHIAKATEPTCTEQGYTTYTCECGDSYVADYVDETGHSYTAETTTPATHLTTGVMTYTCDCGDTYTETIEKTAEHDYKTVVTAPTCTEKGYTTYTCECGDSYVDDYVAENGHNHTSEITTPATHLTTGVETFTCECGDTYTETIEKITEHTYDSVVTAPTCTEQGYTTYTCECGDTYVSDYVAVIDHGYKATVTRPTCTEKGYTTNVCSSCGDSYIDNYKGAIGHDYDNGIVTTKPTCTKAGIKTFTCANCGDTYTEDVDALGHTPSSEVEENYVAPICTENGSKDVVIYCSACDEEISRETVILDASGHADNDGDGYCDVDNELLDPTVECECNCHKSGISKFFFNFILFFQRLFGANKECACGVAHY